MSDFDLGPTAAPTAPAANTASPIADLSYRGYDGPLLTRSARWWVVALSTLRLARKKPGFWILGGLSALPYVGVMIGFYTRAQMPPGLDGAAGQASAGSFAETFYGASFGQSGGGLTQFLLFLTALLVGAGSIASDNRSNALLIYLARPITKGDYLLGKWAAVFLALFGVASAPALAAYLFGVFSLTGEGGVWAADRLLALRLLGACAAAAAVHTSLVVGFSAWSKSSRIAGAVYAGFYLLSGIAAALFGMILSSGAGGVPDPKHVAFRLSVGGVIESVAQNIFNLTLKFPFLNQRRGQGGVVELPPPNLWVVGGVALGLVLLGLLAARAKVRAVEIVKG